MAELRERILERDARGYTVLEGITYGGRKSLNTASKPCSVVAIDGKTYWVKAEVQQGLVAELVAGRLADKLHCGPPVRVLRVTPGVLSSEPDCAHLEGIVFGSREVPASENGRDLGHLLADGRFAPGVIDEAARARVGVFQTWVGADDAQVLVGFRDGGIWSIDHGAVFGALTGGDPVPTVTSVPGVGDDVGRRMGDLMAAVAAVEELTEADFVDAVSGIPYGDPWRSLVERRVEIVDYLLRRRRSLRDVIRGWAT